MFEVTDLNVFYGQSQVIRDVSLQVAPGEAVALMGRNGMGKSTLLKSLIGMLPSRSGSIRLAQQELAHSASHLRVRAGLAFVPQGRMIFSGLTVEQNILAGMQGPGREVPEYLYRYFPVLREMRLRKGGNLSGGQQQMLAIARALVSEPRLLILDEPTEGVQPSIVKDIARTLHALRTERGFAVLVSEQALGFALEVADRFLVIDGGRIVHQAQRAALDQEQVRAFLTI
ncbi:MAG: urea ABC transporter ATP-binding subunit UrtE [Pseudomonadota bacterium]